MFGIATAREAEIQHFNDQQLPDEMSKMNFGTICSIVKLLFRGTHQKNRTVYRERLFATARQSQKEI